MITEKDLREAIAECQGQRNPSASTCIKLAAFLTIQREMFGEHEQPSYSFASGSNARQDENIIQYESDTEFSQMAHGLDVDAFMALMDEMMTILQVTNRPLYEAVLRKIEKL